VHAVLDVDEVLARSAGLAVPTVMDDRSLATTL
jgi:hypothetical protein